MNEQFDYFIRNHWCSWNTGQKVETNEEVWIRGKIWQSSSRSKSSIYLESTQNTKWYRIQIVKSWTSRCLHQRPPPSQKPKSLMNQRLMQKAILFFVKKQPVKWKFLEANFKSIWWKFFTWQKRFCSSTRWLGFDTTLLYFQLYRKPDFTPD